MNMKVVKTSTEIIKPSSPTPTHLRRLRRSFIDQITPKFFMAFIYYYLPPPTNADPIPANRQRIDRLKQSLADVLPLYYPFAGRETDPLFIDCDDTGVEFSESVVVDLRISDVVAEKNPKEVRQLLPFQDLENGDNSRILSVQANVFECGGLAVGICMSHKIADTFSAVTFINSWAASANGKDPTKPEFDVASVFPPRDLPEFRNAESTDDNRKDEKIINRVFNFSNSSISSLKEKYATPEIRPSGVEAVSTFIWTRYIQIGKHLERSGVKYIATQALNLRTRADPKLDSYSGNLSWFAMGFPDMGEPAEKGYGLVAAFREGIKKVDGEYVKRLQNGDVDLALGGLKEVTGGDVVRLGFSSMNRFPFYEADFGWGKPDWVSLAHFDFKNVVAFLPAASGDGVEVWINLEEEEMKKLESDNEFMEFIA
ncbi:stemmadenine O-acetyltransferase-like [Impatiens glandulifera]|uniref:stemmadenine O-acetyltransferase-like n=1 Tax=Impatiens glandulifera TaxID=253017 RepID=UPI001FB07127|nr:stemmadenine O-acetyltransferase-like [Impatiens glandulifera]